MGKINILKFSCFICLFFWTGEACKKSEYYEEKQKGTLLFTLNPASITIDDYVMRTSLVDSSQYSVVIYDSDDSDAVLSYGSYSDVPDEITLPIGDYYVVAETPCDELPAFDAPQYGGTSDVFTIYSLSKTQICLDCAITDIMVGVVYSDSVASTYTSYSTTISNDVGSLTFTEDETRQGFFSEGPLLVTTNLAYTLSGVEKSVVLTGLIIDPEPGHYYEVNVESQAPEGSSFLSITTTDIEDTVAVEINDEFAVSLSDDILITEIMANPDSLSDAAGEWLELYNTTTEDIDLENLFIMRAGGTAKVIDESVSLPAGGYVVLAVSDTATDYVDYVYSGITLSNSGDILELGWFDEDTEVSTIIFYLDYGADDFPEVEAGYSLQLDPSVRTLAESRNGANWCYPGDDQTYGKGDHGTPGSQNTSCDD